MRLFIFSTCCFFLLLGHPILAQDSLPDLSGKWVLNELLSTDLGAALKQAMGQSRGGGGRGEVGGGMSGGRGGGMGGEGKGGGRGKGGGPSAGSTEEAQKHLEQIQLEHARLEIFQLLRQRSSTLVTAIPLEQLAEKIPNFNVLALCIGPELLIGLSCSEPVAL